MFLRVCRTVKGSRVVNTWECLRIRQYHDKERDEIKFDCEGKEDTVSLTVDTKEAPLFVGIMNHSGETIETVLNQ